MTLPKNLPHSIVSQLRQISFKSMATLMNHVRTLYASWRYSQPARRTKAVNARSEIRHQAARAKQCHLQHAEACRQGYQHKIKLVETGRGHNTLSGIPA